MKRVMRNAVFFAAIAASVSLSSCRDSKENEEEGMPMQNEHHQETETSMKEMQDSVAAPQFNEKATGRIYEAYIGIKEALVASNAMDAQKSAQKLVNEIKKDTDRAELVNAANKILATEDINVQREAFSDLASAMQPVLQGAITSGEIYRQYCPMAFEGKGAYWYSNSKQIRNPYFGEKMLNCGRTEETLN
ncbi:DUF3347 domain-containing protein [Zunongwangia sp. F363]|uniref:DUF3347 domain-containing protein n=1 Tax=Autumnicola tepida TaxID=3075595 RepID=A0ABU3CC92_9FLAO|nr:DUF3347 domain-containing protein [Zunongwangia sp. F363]MDT0643645.1 DUF3347 domain-containing protein [Zunongwangia sp. F363]